MKRFSIILIFTFCAVPMLAQDVSIHQTKQGFYLAFGRDIPYNFNYRVSRRAGNESYEIIGETSLPVSLTEYGQRIIKYQLKLTHLPQPRQKQIEGVWQHVSRSGSPDSLLLTSVLEQLGLGLAWLDTTVEAGKRYQYKIERIENDNAISSSETGTTLFSLSSESGLPKASYFRQMLIDGQVITRWLLLSKTNIAGFEIFRRDNLRGEFKLVQIPVGYAQNLDSTFIHVKDTLAKRFEVYEYKLRPFDLFGSPGAFTEVVKISNFTNNDFPTLRSFKAVALDNRRIKLQWSMDFEPFLRSIKILRSMSFDSAFVEIAEVSPRDSAYIDVLPKSMENYYYRLKINGPDEVSISTSSTFILYESDLEPERPIGLAARTTEGGVELKWEDRQRNVFGYYVFRREAHEKFTQISEPILANVKGEYHYKDTAESLHGDRFYDYAVKTISDSYVLSEFSDTLSVRPGIDVPVAAPKNLRARKTTDKVYLLWDDMSSIDNNLAGYKVFRKKSFEENFIVLHDSLLSASTNHFIDSAIQQGYAYDYAVKAYNYLESESGWSNKVQLTFFLSLPPPPPDVQVQKISEGVRIVWGEVLTPELKGFDLYRYSAGGKPELVTTVPADQHHFIDEKVNKGELYFYYVTTKHNSGIAGRPSVKVSVRY